MTWKKQSPVRINLSSRTGQHKLNSKINRLDDRCFRAVDSENKFSFHELLKTDSLVSLHDITTPVLYRVVNGLFPKLISTCIK